MSIVQGGSGLRSLSNSVYTYISGTPLADIDVSTREVPDLEVKEMLDKVGLFATFLSLT